MLSVVAIYHCMQFPRKLMNETWKNDKKSSFRSDFGLFGADLGPKRIFYGFHLCKMLDITASYHCMQFQGKLMNQTWDYDKKWAQFWTLWHKFGSRKVFSWILSLLDVRHCCKLLLYATSRKTNESNLTKWQKT